MSNETLHAQWVEQILDEEKSDGRFELFCARYANEVLRVPIVSTSRNYDLGADARSFQTPHGLYFVVATLRTDEAKPKGDIETLTKKHANKKIAGIYLCFSKKMTEDALEKIRSEVEKLLPTGTPITPLSGPQLAEQVALANLNSFREVYLHDYILLQKHKDQNFESPEGTLALAVGAITSKDSIELRFELSKRIILNILQSGPRLTAELLDGCNTTFQLDCLQEPALEFYCSRAEVDKLIRRIESVWEITEAGQIYLDKTRTHQWQYDITGQSSIRNALKQELSFELSEDQWQRIWPCITRGLTELFHLHGQETVACISALVEGQKLETVAREDSWTQLQAVLAKAAQTQDPFIAEEVEAALRSVFSPAYEGVFSWLLHLACAYTALCTLGLEQRVGNAVTEVMKGFSFSFDTHVILSYLCSFRPEHKAATAVKRAAEELGKQIIVPFPVIGECAHHAAIAGYDFNANVTQYTPPFPHDDIDRQFTNAFAQEFEHIRTNGQHSYTQWAKWITTYAGKYQNNNGKVVADVENMRRFLMDDKFEIGAQLSSEELSTANEVHNVLSFATKDMNTGIEAKLRTDARVLTSIAKAQKLHEQQGIRYSILVTSATQLRHLPNIITDLLGTIPTTMKLSEIMWILSLMPNKAVPLEALGTFLFEGRVVEAFHGLEKRFALALHEIKSAKPPNARKNVLLHRLREGIIDGARTSNVSEREFEHSLDDEHVAALYIAKLVDAQTVRDPVEAEEIKAALKEVGNLIKERKKKKETTQKFRRPF